MTDPDRPAVELGYGDALAELDAIVRELEGDAVDVDHLATRVSRAAELIATCRARIAAARFEVNQVVADLAPDPSVTGPDPEPGPDS